MDMSADDAVGVTTLCFVGQFSLKFTDEFDCLLIPQLVVA